MNVFGKSPGISCCVSAMIYRHPKPEAWLAHAIADGRVLVTRDMHFANILLYPPANHCGVIVLRITPQSIDPVHHTLAAALQHFTAFPIDKKLVIVTRGSFRTRS